MVDSNFKKIISIYVKKYFLNLGPRKTFKSV